MSLPSNISPVFTVRKGDVVSVGKKDPNGERRATVIGTQTKGGRRIAILDDNTWVCLTDVRCVARPGK